VSADSYNSTLGVVAARSLQSIQFDAINWEIDMVILARKV